MKFKDLFSNTIGKFFADKKQPDNAADNHKASKIVGENFSVEDADYSISDNWGDNISWMGSRDITSDTKSLRVSGHKQKIPAEGQTLVAEYQKSWVLYEFTKVSRAGNPSDMFFATVVSIGQKMKADM